MKKSRAGFTLIELVIVIVILGILAAAALPRFSDLSADARIASLNGLAGSVRSAAAIAHATQLAKGYASNVSVTLEGNVIDMAAGYPLARDISSALTDITGYSVNFVSGNTSVQFRLLNSSTCAVEYGQANSATGYNISTNTAGCS